ERYAVESRDRLGDERIAACADAGDHFISDLQCVCHLERERGIRRAGDTIAFAHGATSALRPLATLGVTAPSTRVMRSRIFSVCVRYALRQTMRRGEISATSSCISSLCTRTVSPVSTRS